MLIELVILIAKYDHMTCRAMTAVCKKWRLALVPIFAKMYVEFLNSGDYICSNVCDDVKKIIYTGEVLYILTTYKTCYIFGTGYSHIYCKDIEVWNRLVYLRINKIWNSPLPLKLKKVDGILCDYGYIRGNTYRFANVKIVDDRLTEIKFARYNYVAKYNIKSSKITIRFNGNKF